MNYHASSNLRPAPKPADESLQMSIVSALQSDPMSGSLTSLKVRLRSHAPCRAKSQNRRCSSSSNAQSRTPFPRRKSRTAAGLIRSMSEKGKPVAYFAAAAWVLSIHGRLDPVTCWSTAPTAIVSTLVNSALRQCPARFGA